MPYAIIAEDKPDSGPLRQQKREEHLAYLEDNKHLLLAGGAHLDDDGTTPKGSLLILDVDDRMAAEAFANGDPYTQAGVFAAVRIVRWRKVFFAGERTG